MPSSDQLSVRMRELDSQRHFVPLWSKRIGKGVAQQEVRALGNYLNCSGIGLYLARRF